jgi:hypothetical protein
MKSLRKLLATHAPGAAVLVRLVVGLLFRRNYKAQLFSGSSVVAAARLSHEAVNYVVRVEVKSRQRAVGGATRDGGTEHGPVTSAHMLASQAGLEMLQRGAIPSMQAAPHVSPRHCWATALDRRWTPRRCRCCRTLPDNRYSALALVEDYR